MGDTVNALADHAALQSDRWLMVAMAIIGLAAGLLLFRWIISDRAAMAKRLTDMTDRHIAVTEKMAEVVATNTAMLQEVKRALYRRGPDNR